MIGGGTAAIDLQGVGNLLRLALGWDWAFLGMGDSDTFSRALPTVIMAGVLVGLGLIAVLLEFMRRARSRASQQNLSSFAETEVGLKPTPTENGSSRRILTEIALVWLIFRRWCFYVTARLS